MFDIFISYAVDDRERVQPFVNYLRSRELKVWWDQDLVGGDQAFADIAEALRKSSFVLLFWSKSAAGAQFVEREVNFAASLGKPVVPVKLDKRSFTGSVGLIVADRQWIDAKQTFPEDSLRLLCNRVSPGVQKLSPTLSCLNMKGGVGKTTLSANLAATFHASYNKSVLLIDLDPQANLSNMIVDSMRYEERIEHEQSVISCFEPSKCTGASSPATDLRFIGPIVGAPPNPRQLAFNLRDPLAAKRFDVILGQFELFKYSLPSNAGHLPSCTSYFDRFLESARRSYDLVFIDAAPSNSFITECAVRGASDIVAPVTPDKYALRGLSALTRLVGSAYPLPSPPRIHVLRNAVPSTMEAAEKAIVEAYPQEMLSARVPQSAFFAIKNPDPAMRVRDTLATLAAYRGQQRIKDALKSACQELLNRIEARIA